MGLKINFDDKRCGYWVSGLGFDFFASLTSEVSENPDEPGVLSYIQCDFVKRNGEDYVHNLNIPIRHAKMISADLLEHLLVREFIQFWAMDGAFARR